MYLIGSLYAVSTKHALLGQVHGVLKSMVRYCSEWASVLYINRRHMSVAVMCVYRLK